MKISLLENALDFILSALEHVREGTQRGLKYSVLHLSSGVELLIKERLKREHWTLLFADVDKADQNALKQGNFKSTDLQSALKRLKDICQIDLIKHGVILENLKNIRNRIEHFEFKGTQEEVISILVRAWSFVLDFIHDQLYDNLSEENQKSIAKIKEAMVEEQDFIESREKEIKPRLDQIKKDGYGAILNCPVCLQEALTVNGEDPHCVFCRYSDDSEGVADKWCTVFVGSSYTDPKERFTSPVLFSCPECASETMLQQEDSGEYPPDPAWVCFSCGLTAEHDEIDFCSRCTNPFIKTGDDVMCSDCWKNLE